MDDAGGQGRPRRPLPRSDEGARGRRDLGVGDVAGNVETLRAAYAALDEGDLEAALRYAADDFTIKRAGPDPPVRGKEAVRAFMAPDAFSEQHFEPLEFQENGDRVFAWVQVRATGAGSGIAMEQEVAHVWEYRNGFATSLTVSFDRDEALAAAGLAQT